jgi:hypothetical protein
LTARQAGPYDPPMANLIDNAKRARQLARAIASDLTLYHEAKILDGISNDNLFDVMHDEINDGRELFKSRVTDDIFAQNIYERAIVDVLVKSKGHVKSKIW